MKRTGTDAVMVTGAAFALVWAVTGDWRAGLVAALLEPALNRLIRRISVEAGKRRRRGGPPHGGAMGAR